MAAATDTYASTTPAPMNARARTAGLFVVLFALFIGVGWLIAFLTGGSGILTVGLFLGFAVVFNLVVYFFSDKIALRAHRAKIVEEDEAPRLHRIVRHICNTNGLPMPRIAVIPTKMPNAFATGRNPEHATVAATEGILELLDDDELEGVMAHEMAHVSNRDTLIMTIAATVAATFAIGARFLFWGSLFRGRRDGGSMLIMLALMALAAIGAFLLKMAISRSREFLADETGARYCAKPWALANALEKLERGVERNPPKRGEASPASESLYIVSPFKGSAVAKLFSSHPPTEERVARLNAM